MPSALLTTNMNLIQGSWKTIFPLRETSDGSHVRGHEGTFHEGESHQTFDGAWGTHCGQCRRRLCLAAN